MAIWQENYVLNEESIDKVSYKVYKLLQEKKYPKESLISSRLSLETILLRWLENGGTGKTFEVEVKKSFGRLHIYLRLEGDCIADATQKMDLEYFDRVQEALCHCCHKVYRRYQYCRH